VLTLVLAGLAVVLAGALLTISSDVIAERTGFGKLWVGSVLLAGATSLPELSTDIVAVRMGANDLAVGDLLGSSMANMLILALLDLWLGGRVLRLASLDHALSASLAIALNALAGAALIAQPRDTLYGVSAASMSILALYVIGYWAAYRQATAHPEAQPPPMTPTSFTARWSVRTAALAFAAGALIVLFAAPSFARAAEDLAHASGLGRTFVGTLVVGITTSLPELVACVVAVRLKAYDLAVGNLFGSNAFNMVIFPVLDLASPAGNVLGNADPAHALSAFFAVVLMGLGLAAIVFRARRRLALLEPSSLLMLVTYVAALVALYTRTSRG